MKTNKFLFFFKYTGHGKGIKRKIIGIFVDKTGAIISFYVALLNF